MAATRNMLHPGGRDGFDDPALVASETSRKAAPAAPTASAVRAPDNGLCGGCVMPVV
jgi:hypothetical protein